MGSQGVFSRFFRRGWVTFDRSVNIKEICWSLQNIRVRFGAKPGGSGVFGVWGKIGVGLRGEIGGEFGRIMRSFLVQF